MGPSRRAGLVVLLPVIVVCGWAGAPGGAAASRSEGILELHAEASVAADGTVLVDETCLVWVAGGRIQHGIERDLPTRYSDRRGRRYAVDIDGIKVTRDGRPEPVRLRELADGWRLEIGRPGVALTHGTHVYVTSYRARRQIGFFADADQLFWNVTGFASSLPIEQSSAVVRLPEEAARRMAGLAGFTGRSGSDEPSVVTDRRDLAAVFTATRPLAPGEGLTVVVTWPKGFVSAPPAAEAAVDFLGDNRHLVVAALALIGLLIWNYLARARTPPASGGEGARGPALALAAIALAALAASARGGGILRAGLLAALLPFWTAGTLRSLRGCARAWRRARAPTTAPPARARRATVGIVAAAVFAAGEIAGLALFARQTSVAAAIGLGAASLLARPRRARARQAPPDVSAAGDAPAAL